MRKDLFDLFEKHQDTIFQIYTNGTLIDEKMVERFVALGNVIPAISIEGLRRRPMHGEERATSTGSSK